MRRQTGSIRLLGIYWNAERAFSIVNSQYSIQGVSPLKNGIFASLQQASSIQFLLFVHFVPFCGFIKFQISSFTLPFSLTYKVVMCKRHSAAFPNQVSSFNPLRKEDLKWPMVARKPRYSDWIESGVLYFVAQGNTHGKRYGIERGLSQSR